MLGLDKPLLQNSPLPLEVNRVAGGRYIDRGWLEEVGRMSSSAGRQECACRERGAFVDVHEVLFCNTIHCNSKISDSSFLHSSIFR